MINISGWIISSRKTTNGTWHTIYDESNGPVDFFARNSPFTLLDKAAAQLDESQNNFFLRHFDITEQSPLHDNPQNLVTASYISALTECFAHAGMQEAAFISESVTLLKEPKINAEDIAELEMNWIYTMGLSHDKNITAIIEDHIGEKIKRRGFSDSGMGKGRKS